MEEELDWLLGEFNDLSFSVEQDFCCCQSEHDAMKRDREKASAIIASVKDMIDARAS